MNASCGMSTLPNWRMRFLPSFCFSRSLRFARHVAAVAFGGDVLAERAHRLAGDDLAAGSGCRVHLRPGELPKGRLVVSVTRQHYTAVIDGTGHDIVDPCRGGTRCVYGYWRIL